MLDDTICAPATPPVISSLAILRISGPGTTGAVRSVFSNADKAHPRRAVYGSILDGAEVIDDVIVVTYQSPASFTGEDSAEIICHGNPIVVNKILALLLRHGLRMAEPGEFSKRAFLNGKIDLTEAEAINHIITARSDWEIKASIRQMHGSLKNRIHEIRDRLVLLKADIECGIDFSEEEIEFVSYKDAEAQVREISRLLDDIAYRCRIGEKISHGIDVPIVGKPNVGKSSILNMIVNAERAIVSDTPGTTRDLIRESVQFGGLRLNIFDTAGIDEPTSDIERMGIELSFKKIEAASLVIMVVDAASGMREADEKIFDALKGKNTIVLLNKTDIAQDDDIARLRSRFDCPTIPFSARSGRGLKELENAVTVMLRSEFASTSDFFVADIRMRELLGEAIAAAGDAAGLLRDNEPPEIAAFQIQTLIDTLAEITGEITPDDVLESIFSRFCIGK